MSFENNNTEKKMLLIENINKDICSQVLKSGKNKGKECGRINCGIHNKNNNIII